MTYGPLETEFLLAKLQPGDVLLFNRRGFYNWVIRHATNSRVTHTEVYVGRIDGRPSTAACRNGVGVNFYDLVLDGLVMILHPKQSFDLPAALSYQRSVIGETYDWTGLWRAFVHNKWGRDNAKQWCSENTTLVQRAGGIEPFAPDNPADMVAPGDFVKSGAYWWQWKAKGY